MPTVKLKNVTNRARFGVVTLGIPFTKEDNLQESDILVVDGAYFNQVGQRIQWKPQGARWGNGGIKYANANFSVSLLANEERRVQVRRASSFNIPPSTFFRDSVMFNSLLQTQFSFVINNTTFDFTVQDALLWPNTTIEDTGVYGHLKRSISFIRPFPNHPDEQYRHLWIQLVVEELSNLRHANFYFRYGFFKFRTGFPATGGLVNLPGAIPPVFLLSSNVTLTINGMYSRIRAEQWQIPFIENPGGISRRYTLIQPTATLDRNRIAAGMSFCYKGVLCLNASEDTNIAELENNGTFPITQTNPSISPNTAIGETWLPSSQILAIAEDWKNIYPVTNVQPPRPSYVTSDADYFQRSNHCLAVLTKAGPGTRLSGTPSVWNSCNIGCKPDAKDAGEHGTRNYAYGIRGMAFMQPANYYWIPLLEYNVRAEALRSNFWVAENGAPINPTLLDTEKVYVWDGLFFNIENGNSFGGYSRQIQPSDLPYSISGGRYLGPDKEHWTNSMTSLCALITMDWFSLEYAKQYVTHTIAANRTAFTSSFSDIVADWGATRAAGRISQVFSYLYEITNDQTLKYWSKRRIVDVVARTANPYNPNLAYERMMRRHLLRQNFTSTIDEPTPEGNRLDKLKFSMRNASSTQGAGLDDLAHWRPWEEGEVVLGFYFLAKSLLEDDPNDSVGLQLLTYARDVAGSIVVAGVQDLRPSASSNRLIYLQFPQGTGTQSYDINRFNFLQDLVGAAGLNDSYFFANQIGSIDIEQVELDTNTNTLVPTNPPAGGRIGLMYVDGEFYWNRNLSMWLKNAYGTFLPNKLIRRRLTGPSSPSTTFTGTVYRVFDLLGFKSKAVQSSLGATKPAGEAYDINQSEMDTIRFPNIPSQVIGATNLYNSPGVIPNSSDTWAGWGYFRFHRDYYVYTLQVSPALAIAREAALLGFYSNSIKYPNANATILQKVDEYKEYILSTFSTNYSSTSYTNNYTNDINEQFLCFVGYLNNSFFGNTPNLPILVTAPAQICSTSTPQPTTSITNQQASVSVVANTSTCESSVLPPSTLITNPTNVTRVPSVVDCISSIFNSRSTANITISVSSVPALEAETPIISALVLTSILPGKKISTVITMGFSNVEPPEFGTEDAPPDLGRHESSDFESSKTYTKP